MAFYRKRGEKWEYRISFVDRRTGKAKETTKGGFRTKKEAQIAAAEAESAINHFGFGENGSEKVDKFLRSGWRFTKSLTSSQLLTRFKNGM